MGTENGAPAGPLLASGRTADVYALPGGRVLRRYRNGRDAGPEARLLLRLGRLGYPVPRVHPHPEPGEAGLPGDLVMERLHGPTLLRAVLDGSESPARTGATLARLLDQLHALPGGLVHLDLHPENVLRTARGPVVIDWCNAREGRPPGRDRAVSALILAETASGPYPVAGPMLTALLDALRPAGDGGDQPPFTEAELTWAGDLRRANPTLDAAERRAVDLALERVAEQAASPPKRTTGDR
ncbi:phosphotransferase [Streptomyces sedi]|uniref:Aminoglycoside phosphotransferase family protein n=1 Tax=Streptomyces sedi TaxID=555059 RepID=A0A5C4V835_9ACTN|nr:phosphotransferase [Streptomyces sedi]TNM32132.1 aminoglycoside phosphotransferase family protein [Streptomyces sedi]